ncbi:MAG: hypothetical protein ACI4XM_05305 [Candidatus Coprovivens sp.]
MKRCPKCNLGINNNARKCKYCGFILPKKIKDQIEKQPDIIKTPNKITTTESLELTEEIKIKPIPLKVKPVKSPKPIEEKQTIKKNQILSSIKIVLVSLLLIINIFLIIKIISSKEQESSIPNNNISNNKTTSKNIGSWRTSNNSLFTFDDNNNFYWYEYYDDLKNNYYSGTYNYKKGLDALNEMGYTEEEFYTTFTDIKIENVYSMNLLPTYSFKANTNMTEEDLAKNETWWYILMIRNDGTAIAYNKTLDIHYNLIKS